MQSITQKITLLLISTFTLQFSFAQWSENANAIYPTTLDKPVGIGTTTPVSKIDLGTNYSDPSTYPNKITLWQGGANNYFGFGVSTNTLDYFSQGNHRFFTGYNGTAGSAKMLIQVNGNVGIGTDNPQVKLEVAGIIKAKQVKVTQSGWADYVFDKDYKLMSLTDLSNYINQHKHLPEIPSTKQIEKEGIDVGTSQALLLKKIEELTLYVIKQNKQLAKQGKQMIEQQKEIKAQRRELEFLKNKLP